MNSTNEILARAVDNHDVPFVVAMTANSGGITSSSAAGDAAPHRKAAEDTVFRIFSMTKAIGSTAAMILIDRGKLDFDTLVETIIPEFSTIQVLERFDGDQPVLRAPRTKATIRHLATHTSGLEYEFWNPDVAKYLAVTKHPPILSGTRQGLHYPMMTDPGTRWGYGMGIDWLGQVVERIDGRRIDRFCHEEIFAPLGMSDTVFELSESMRARLAAVAARGEDGRFAPFDIAPPATPEIYGMGHALYSTAPDYIKFLRLFLNHGTLNGHRLLSESGVQRMLADQMGGLAFQKMISAAPPITADCDPFPDTPRTHSFGFMRLEQDVPGMRSGGSQTWAGVLNTHFWIDPKKDLAAVIMTQTLPFLEPRFVQLYGDYEKAVYAG